VQTNPANEWHTVHVVIVLHVGTLQIVDRDDRWIVERGKTNTLSAKRVHLNLAGKAVESVMVEAVAAGAT
jgi:hypothetical protein